jgi:uncharacterized protein YndB with AHSA1/START domain
MIGRVRTVKHRQVSASRLILAPPEAIFELLADPSRHPDIDGSGTVRATREPAGTRLSLGSRFGMAMRLGVPYAINNVVVDFEEGRRITWRHFGGHRWRWELEPVEGGTRVTETFDWSTSRSPVALEVMRVPARNARSIEATLDRLEQLFSEG